MDKFEYAPAPESAALVDIKSEYGLFINGKFVAPKSGKYFDNVSPINNEVICSIPRSDAKDVEAALDAAYGLLGSYLFVSKKAAPFISNVPYTSSVEICKNLNCAFLELSRWSK